MEEQLVPQPDHLAQGATRLWQQSFGRGSRIPHLEINLLRDRQLQQQEEKDRQNGYQTNPRIFATTEQPKIIPKTNMEINWQPAMEENSLPDLIVPGTVGADFTNDSGEALEISLNSPVLADLIDLHAYEQLETGFAVCVQKLEKLTGGQQPTDEQVQQLESRLEQMQSELIEMRQSMAKAFTTQKRTEKQYNFVQSVANNWEPRAHIALQKGDENLAKEALFRYKANSNIAASLRFSLDWQLPLVDTIKQSIIELEVKISEIKIQKELLTALLSVKAIGQIQTALKARLENLEILKNGDEPTQKQIQYLESIIEQLQSYLVQIRACTTQATTAQKNTQQQFNLAQSLANNCHRRAQNARQKRDDAQVKEWSIRQKTDADIADCLKVILELQTAQVDLLKYNLIALEITIPQLKTEKELLKVSASLQNQSDRWQNPSNQ
jgi:phage shock protein A